ncbi:MAG: alanine--tRNA ligase, partial [Firmicutes bacterium]|nr:alanine--tRNA ligase [Bacillota bacterium]
LAGMNIKTDVMTMEEARKSGAMALFGEKYGESVRVVSMGDYSKELCGGTHLKNTAQVGSFKIVSENGVAAGVRRIEALTGTGALEYYEKQEQELNQVASVLKSKKDRLVESAESLMEQMKELQRELASLQSKLASGAADDILKAAEKVGEISVLTAYKPEMDANALRQLGDSLKDKLGECVILLAGGSDKLNFVAMATEGAVKAGAHAGNIIKEAAKTAGGGGGGRPNMAQAGGKDASKAEAALEAGKAVALSQLG